MNIEIKAYDKKYINEAAAIWNRVVEDGVAFPQLELLDAVSADAFFTEQSFTGLAFDADSGELAGLHSPSQQYRPLRSYLQRKLRRERGYAWQRRG